jgi:hypothetical protein
MLWPRIHVAGNLIEVHADPLDLFMQTANIAADFRYGSFTGAGLYYFHDKGAETDERVEWTHTINCNADEPDLALKEIRTTAANQSLLKEAAGIPLTGNKTKDTLKTISLA